MGQKIERGSALLFDIFFIQKEKAEKGGKASKKRVWFWLANPLENGEKRDISFQRLALCKKKSSSKRVKERVTGLFRKEKESSQILLKEKKERRVRRALVFSI